MAAGLDVQNVFTFDEESCRYFLREVGEQVVPYYPFSFGIDEVYNIVFERYGREGIADALSVLHDLLEGDDNANGLGDDGDIWRSWRHNWKHRNDDPLNPSIPRVGNFILPPPSSKTARRFRATQYLRLAKIPSSTAGNRINVAPPGPTSNRKISRLADNTPKHRDRSSRLILTPEGEPAAIQATSQDEYELQTRSLLHRTSTSSESDTSSSEMPDADSQQDFSEVDPSVTPADTDPASLISFEIIRPPLNGHHQSNLLGGQEVCTLLAVSTPDRKKDTTDSQGPEREQKRDPKNSLDEMVQNWGLETFGSRDNLALDFDIHFRLNSSDIWAIPRHTPCSEGSRPISELKGQDHHAGCGTDKISRIISCDQSSPSNTSTYRRAANREARLIDGAIFTSTARKNPDLTKLSTNESVEDVTSSKRSSFRASWAGIRQKGVRLFRKEPQNKHRQESKSESPTNNNNKHDDDRAEMPQKRSDAVDDTPPSSTAYGPGRYTFGLDGAWDDYRPQSPVNLNKALPLQPGSVRTDTPSLSQGTTRPSTASTVSSAPSRTSNKRVFRDAARGLIDMADLSSLRESRAMLDSANFDPARSPRSANTQITFSSIANNNPFIDNTQPMSQKKPDPLFIPKRVDHQRHGQNGVGTFRKSPSEPNIAPYSPKETGRAGYYIPQELPASPARISDSRGESSGKEERRGRAAHRPNSPTYAAFRMQDQVPLLEKTPKRSRSPVKKLLGFGKSTSLKDIAGEVPTQPAPKSPSKINMTSLKSWGSRVRHGFMVLDEETEAPARAAVKPPPSHFGSPPPLSTFSVGLDPPYQAKVLMEIELMICVSANRYLMSELKHGRLSTESVATIKRSWADRNRPQVIEFQYDQTTQRELVLANLKTVRLYGEPGENPIVLNGTLYNWKVLAKDLSVRTFCSPDSAIRKHMHDTHKILEMLGAPLVTFLAFGDMQVKALSKMTEKQKERAEKKREPTAARRVDTPAPNSSMSSRSGQNAFQIDESPTKDFYENSLGGRLGARVRDRV